MKIGNYDVLDKLGEGAFGEVFKASDPTGNLVAIKVIKKGSKIETQVNEIIKLKVLSRDTKACMVYIPCIIDTWETPDSFIVVMQFIKGKNLSEYIRTFNYQLPQEDFVFKTFNTMIHIAKGIKYIHGLGISHKDLKPENIILEEPSHIPIIVDFGISCFKTNKACLKSKIGSPGYIPPEVWEGEKSNQIFWTESDIFSLGCTYYELLTGIPAFTAPSWKLMEKKILNYNPFPIASQITPLDSLIFSMMSKNPEDRPDIDDVIDNLEVIRDQYKDAPASSIPIAARAISVLGRAAETRLMNFEVVSNIEKPLSGAYASSNTYTNKRKAFVGAYMDN